MNFIKLGSQGKGVMRAGGIEAVFWNKYRDVIEVYMAEAYHNLQCPTVAMAKDEWSKLLSLLPDWPVVYGMDEKMMIDPSKIDSFFVNEDFLHVHRANGFRHAIEFKNSDYAFDACNELYRNLVKCKEGS